MNKENNRIDDLKKKLKDCRTRLLELLDDWHYMQNVIHPRIMFKYENIFGDVEFKLRSKTAEAANIEKRIEEYLTKLKLDSNDSTFNNFRNNVISEIDNEEFSKVYRKIVKSLHPDINGHTEEFEKYWDNIQKAYKENNYTRLKLFEVTLCDLKDIDENIEERSIGGQIAELESYIKEEEQKLKRLKYEEPFCFENKLNDLNWVIRRRSLLNHKLDQAEKKLKYQQKMLSNMASRHKNTSLGEELKDLIAS